MARRLDKTLADYVAIAISPVLIMTLVGSLVFFLAEVFYQGQYSERLHLVLALFVMAAVLIGRISIELGEDRALAYATPLAVVTVLAINRFVEYPSGPAASFGLLINMGLVGLIWWSAHKLTIDCTLIDEQEESSGEGLLSLSVLARWRKRRAATSDVPAEPAAPAEPEGVTSRDEPPARRAWLFERPKRPHAPGVWIVYFSLAALPLFGVGHLLIPRSLPAERQYAFFLLLIYVASGLGLLLTTSFLGLRRYLRQRRIEMPPTMAAAWLGMGGALALLLLALATILPRPGAETVFEQELFRALSPDRSASRAAVGNDGTKTNRSGAESETNRADAERHSAEAKGREQGPRQEGEQSGRQAEGQAGRQQGEPTDQQPGQQDDSPSREKSRQPSAGPIGQKSPKPPPEKASGPSRSSQPKAPDTPDPHPNLVPSLRKLSGALGEMIRWAVICLLALVVLVALWHYRHEIVDALNRLISELQGFWARLFGGRRAAGETSDDQPAALAARPLAAFADPFATGEADRLSAAELIRYTFAAVEAWGREHGCPRGPEQTPHEFARRIAACNEDLADDCRLLADLYAHLAYSPAGLRQTVKDRLRPLWEKLGAPAPVGQASRQ